MLYGLLANGPALHWTYSRIIPKMGPAACMRALGKKLLFTQTIFSLVSIFSFYVFVSKCEGNSNEETLEELNAKFWPTYITNLKVWPVLQLINFTLVPPQFQVLYVNFVQVWWNVYLSFVKNQPAIDLEAASESSPSAQE